MFNIKGKYTGATVYTDICEDSAVSQIYSLCNHPVFKDSFIKVMPDCLIETTEILTTNGFKYIKDLTYQDLIANISNDNKVRYNGVHQSKPL